MKPLNTILAVLLPAFTFAQNSDLTIKGSIAGVPQPVSRVAVVYRSGEETVRDTITVDKGSYKYKRTLAEPVLAQIYFLSDSVLVRRGMSTMKFYNFPVFLEPGAKIAITTRDSVQNHVVKGSKAHAAYEALQAQAKPYEEAETALYEPYAEARKANNKPAMDRIEAQLDSIDEVMKSRVWSQYVRSNPGSPIALYALREYAGYSIDPLHIDPLFAALPEATRQSPSGLQFASELETARKTSIGQLAMDFTQNDTLENPVSLSSFRGKYLLVDFWASWCGPCRRENPNVVAAFNKYKDKNFTILGVSLDRPGQKEAWLKAIRKDGLAWNHVSDLKFWDNAVAKQYAIRAIPANLLLDPQGKIIAKNLSGEELQKKLAEVLQ